MTTRNIAIANFVPNEVHNSSWPRFVGFKDKRVPKLETGLFGLVDGNTRMHAFFYNTTIERVIEERLNYMVATPDIRSVAKSVTYTDQGVGMIEMPTGRKPDQSIRWLPPYQWVDAAGTEWDVYVLITGKDIHIKGNRDLSVKVDGYWCMGIWRPKFVEGEPEVWTDIARIEQATINYVHTQGFQAVTSVTMFEDNPGYGTYKNCDVTREIPPRVAA